MVKDETPPEEGVLTLRVSDVRTWLQCPRRFYLEVLQGLRLQVEGFDDPELQEVRPEEVVVTERQAGRRDEGTLVHSVIEAYYKSKIDLTFDTYMTIEVSDLILAAAQELTPEPDTKSWVDARRYAQAMAEGYIYWVAADGRDIGYETLAVEERITLDFKVNTGKAGYHTIRLTGQPDVVEGDQMAGEEGIGDTKTVTSLKNSGPRAHDFQLSSYALLRWRKTGVMPTYGYQNLILRSLHTSRSTPPYYRRVPITFTEDQLKQFSGFLIATLFDISSFIRNLEVPDLVAYSETQLCDWMCSVVPVCDAMSSGQPGGWQSLANRLYGGNYEEVFDG